ncbi:hypothetical protein [Haliscomenobacter sp.]|uniref:hypothetical protein n=1 Tax=Haliscomenobacter sp. TaxID=2717303 RepID=UPI0035937BB6
MVHLYPHFRAHTFDGAVAAIGVQSNNELVLAGTNLKIGNRTQAVFRFDSTGQVDPDFNPQPTSVSNFIVQNMAILPSGTLGFLAGDGFNVSVFDRTGQILANHSLSNERASLHRASSNSFLILGQRGYEVFENGEARDLQVVNANGYVFWATEQQNSRLVLTGGFTSTSAFLLKLDAAGQIVQAPTLTHTSNNFPGLSELFELPNGSVLVAGVFNRYNDIPVNNHIVIDKNAQLISNFLPEMPAETTYSTTANIDGNSMYLGGIFTAPNGAVGLVKITDLLTSSSTVVNKVKKGKIFPNPNANETLYLELDSKIQSSSVQYQMLEMGSGKVLESGRVVNPALQSFDLKALKQGAYVLRLLGTDWEESHVFSKVK